jgi:hypothetical protein
MELSCALRIAEELKNSRGRTMNGIIYLVGLVVVVVAVLSFFGLR